MNCPSGRAESEPKSPYRMWRRWPGLSRHSVTWPCHQLGWAGLGILASQPPASATVVGLCFPFNWKLHWDRFLHFLQPTEESHRSARPHALCNGVGPSRGVIFLLSAACPGQVVGEGMETLSQWASTWLWLARRTEGGSWLLFALQGTAPAPAFRHAGEDAGLAFIGGQQLASMPLSSLLGEAA